MPIRAYHAPITSNMTPFGQMAHATLVAHRRSSAGFFPPSVVSDSLSPAAKPCVNGTGLEAFNFPTKTGLAATRRKTPLRRLMFALVPAG